jgi:hypothetical protein
VKRLLCAFGAVLLISGSTAVGHEGATGVVKQRMDEMEQIGRTVKRINDRLKSKRGFADIARDADTGGGGTGAVAVPAGKPGRAFRGDARGVGAVGRSSWPPRAPWRGKPRSLLPRRGQGTRPP